MTRQQPRGGPAQVSVGFGAPAHVIQPGSNIDIVQLLVHRSDLGGVQTGSVLPDSAVFFPVTLSLSKRCLWAVSAVTESL